MPSKNMKEWRAFIDENTSYEVKERKKAFWTLHNTAINADSYMETYRSLFF